MREKNRWHLIRKKKPQKRIGNRYLWNIIALQFVWHFYTIISHGIKCGTYYQINRIIVLSGNCKTSILWTEWEGALFFFDFLAKTLLLCHFSIRIINALFISRQWQPLPNGIIIIVAMSDKQWRVIYKIQFYVIRNFMSIFCCFNFKITINWTICWGVTLQNNTVE